MLKSELDLEGKDDAMIKNAAMASRPKREVLII